LNQYKVKGYGHYIAFFNYQKKNIMSNIPNTLNSLENVNIHKSKIVIVRTEWNDAINAELVKGALEILSQHRDLVSVQEITVPGAIEITSIIRQHWRKRDADAYIAFGCVLQGETPHFDYVCKSVTEGITRLNLEQEAPTIFGLLTVLNEQQAWDRLGGTHGHKGREAAITALKMIDLLKKI
jgi:6,7-dimethyl-8-ribityllumazine synthase